MDTVFELNSAGNETGWRDWLRRSARVLLEPARFFRYDYAAMSTPTLLTFGIANAWAASVIAFFVQTINSLLLSQLLDRWMQRLISSDEALNVWEMSGKTFLYTSGATLLGPFLFLLQAAFGGFGLFLFARLLIEDRPGAPEAVTFESALRIRAAALLSEWYALVPVFGGLLAFIAHLVLAVTGVRERYGVSTRRATAVVLAPYMLLGMFAVVLGALALVALSQIPLQELMGELDTKQLGF